jgi:protein-tyrosine phosphatase
MDIWWIDPQLAVASAPVGGEGLRISVARLAGLEEATLVVSCLTDAEEIELGLSGESVALHAAGVAFRRMRIVDYGTPGRRALLGLTRVLSRERANGGRVVVHCRGGRGRSPLVAAALLVREGRTPAEAMELVAMRRAAEIPETGEQRALLVSLRPGRPRG